MKILIYTPNYLPATRYGGPVRSVHGLARGLLARGHEIEVFTTNIDGPGVVDRPTGTPVDLDGVKVRYFPLVGPRRIYYSPSMGRAFDAEAQAFDILYINGVFLWPGSRLAKAAVKSGTPFVLAPRGMLVADLIQSRSPVAKRLWLRFQERATLHHAAAIHVTSISEGAEFQKLGLSPAPLALAPNGVELPPRGPQSGLWADAPAGQRVAFLGRLDWMKGLDIAIAAARALPDVHMRIGGFDQEGLRKGFEAELRAAGVANRIKFVGPVDGTTKWEFLREADVLVVPSQYENFGNVVVEAFAVGTPVVCTPGVGASSIVAQIDPRCVVERTPAAVASALHALLADADGRTGIGARSLALMAAEYSWGAIAARMETVFKDAVAQRDHPRFRNTLNLSQE